MRRGTFVAAISVGIAAPILLLGGSLANQGVRDRIGEFFAPLPTATPLPSTVHTATALPPQLSITGAESPELHALVSGDAGAPTDRGPRTALFPREIPVPRDPYERPHGLKRSELASRDDAAVDHAIGYLATDAHGRGALLAALQHSGRHRDEVDRILRAWKLPTELAAVVFVESGFTPTYSSLDGGSGLWSLPREVAHGYGLALLPKYDERRGVALSTEATAHYLADLHERLGSWELALFAFGRGYARAIDAVQKHTSLDYWDLAAELPPSETSYVAEVLAVATMLGNPDRFGLDVVKPEDPEVTSDLEVPADATFAIIARAAGSSVERLRELNPEYLSDTVPATGFTMIMHLPSAGLARAKELLMPLMYATGGTMGAASTFDWGRAAPGRRDGGNGPDDAGGRGAVPNGSQTIVSRGGSRKVYYRVEDGDTLESLARRFGVPRETIASDNALDPSAGLKSGQLLLLRPGGSSGPAPQAPR